MKFLKIFGVVIFVYCCLGIFNIAKAETPDGDPPIYDTPGMVKKPVPVYCGPTEFMLTTAVTQFKQEPLVVGKVMIPTTGEMVGLLTIFVHKDNQFDMSVLMTMLTTGETCVLGYGRQLRWYNEIPTEPSKFKNGVYSEVKINF